MSKIVSAVLLVLLSATIKVNSLECYECTNCAQVTDSQLRTCGDAGTTTSAPTTSTGSSSISSSSTEATTPTTTVSQSSTEATTPTTTVAQTTASTTSPSTEAPSPETLLPSPNDAVQVLNDNTDYHVRKVKRAVMVAADTEVTYVCGILKSTVNNTEIISRGCLQDLGNETQTCAVVSSLGSCSICTTDRCNSAASLHVSVAFILLAAVFRFL